MDGQRCNSSILKLILLLCLPLQFPSCGRQTAVYVPQYAHYVFSAKWQKTKGLVETTDGTLMKTGFSVSAINWETGKEELNDTARYDAENCCFHTEGFYRQNPGTTMNFYAAWPERICGANEGSPGFYLENISSGADPVVASALAVDSGEKCINLNFKHILGRIQIFAKGLDPGVAYSLKSLSVSYPAEGFYSLDDGLWHDTQYLESIIEEGEDLAVIPGTVLVEAYWSCEYQDITLASYRRTASIEVKEGKITSVTLLLTNDGAEELCFETKLTYWQSNPVPLEL